MNRYRLLVLAALVFAGGCARETPREKKTQVAAKPETAPPAYKVKFETSKGDFLVEVTREWAPRGADRFYDLVKTGFYNGARFFRVRLDFVVQFGINGDPAISRLWSSMRLPDDPVKQSNVKGTVTFATAGPETRTTQVFVNLGDNRRLDKQGFAPFGKVVSGMEVVEHFYAGYGECAPRGTGPNQDLIETQGNAYLENKFPRLDFIRKASLAQ
jgi:peptidyl-prolyl cis-trans isomerase A (cyclophilin A)